MKDSKIMLKELKRERDKFKTITAEMYQIIGYMSSTYNIPDAVKILDQLSAAIHGERLPHKTLLPYPNSIQEHKGEKIK